MTAKRDPDQKMFNEPFQLYSRRRKMGMMARTNISRIA